MEREIKFKAFHKPSKTMYWFDLMWGNVYGMGGGWIGMLPIGETNERKRVAVDPNDCEIMQFTGLLDKNGKEIYEGDLIDYGGGRYYPITYEENGFGIKFPNGRHERTWLDLTMFSVIGNIYEKPITEP